MAIFEPDTSLPLRETADFSMGLPWTPLTANSPLGITHRVSRSDISSMNADDLSPNEWEQQGSREVRSREVDLFTAGRRGSRERDRLVGTRQDDALKGRAGNDILLGRGGNDRLNGGRNNDRLVGARGDDDLIGGSGRDRLVGGSGRDRLRGGQDKDKLKGGVGRDIFVMSAREAASSRRRADVVEDFKSGKDKIELSDLAFEQVLLEQGTGRRSEQLFIRNRQTGDYLAILEGVQEGAIAVEDFLPAITEPDIVVVPDAQGEIGESYNFRTVSLSDESEIKALGAPNLRLGSQTFYIGYEQVSSNNQNPVIVSFDDKNPDHNWTRNDYEVTGADSRGYGLFWSGDDLYATFTIDGTQGSVNEDFRRGSGDAKQNWLRSYGSGGGAKVSVIARINPADGKLLDSAYLSAILSSGNSNTLTIESIDLNGSGNLVIQAKSWFSPRNPSGSAMQQLSSVGSPFDYTIEMTPDLKKVVATSADGWR